MKPPRQLNARTFTTTTYLRHLAGLLKNAPPVVSGGGVRDDDQSVGHVGAVAVVGREHPLAHCPQGGHHVEAARSGHCLGQDAQRLLDLLGGLVAVDSMQFTETVRTIRDREPRKATSAFTQLLSSEKVQVQCCFTSTEIVRTISDGEPRTVTSTFRQLLSSEVTSSLLLYVHRDRDHKGY